MNANSKQKLKGLPQQNSFSRKIAKFREKVCGIHKKICHFLKKEFAFAENSIPLVQPLRINFEYFFLTFVWGQTKDGTFFFMRN